MLSKPLIQLKSVYLFPVVALSLILIISTKARSQTSFVPVFDMKSGNRTWLSDIKVIQEDVFMASGLFQERVVFGSDTLRAQDVGHFVARFKNGKPEGAIKSNAWVFALHDKYFFTLDRGGKGYKRQIVSKYDFDNNRFWEYSLALIDSSYARLSVLEICPGESDNTYLLFRIDEDKGEVIVNNEHIQGPANFIVKIDSKGNVIQHRKLSDRHRFNKLRMQDGKICAFGGEKSFYQSVVFNADLNEEIVDEELSLFCKYSLWDNRNFFRIEQEGKRPDRPYYLEKFDPKTKTAKRIVVFRDTLRFQDEIYQRTLLNLNKKELVFVYVSQGVRIENVYKRNLNIVVIRKRNLKIREHAVFECDHLHMGSAGVLEYIPFQVSGKDLLMGNDYTNFTRLGDVVIGDEKSVHANPSFYITRLRLK